MTHQDQLSTAIKNRLDAGQRHFDTAIVSDLQIVIKRDVEVDSHEYGFGGDVGIGNGLFGHGILLRMVIVNGTQNIEEHLRCIQRIGADP